MPWVTHVVAGHFCVAPLYTTSTNGQLSPVPSDGTRTSPSLRRWPHSGTRVGPLEPVAVETEVRYRSTGSALTLRAYCWLLSLLRLTSGYP